MPNLFELLFILTIAAIIFGLGYRRGWNSNEKYRNRTVRIDST
jgi:hypothetical protein